MWRLKNYDEYFVQIFKQKIKKCKKKERKYLVVFKITECSAAAATAAVAATVLSKSRECAQFDFSSDDVTSTKNNGASKCKTDLELISGELYNFGDTSMALCSFSIGSRIPESCCILKNVDRFQLFEPYT